MLVVEAKPRKTRKPQVGLGLPRIGPQMPPPGRLKDYEKAAEQLDLKPYPWQLVAARYCTATTPKGLWLFRDFLAVVARRNGKTQFLLPRIVMALEDGESVLHTAQDRALPRLTFEELCERMLANDDLAKQVKRIRSANGTEAITFKNGGKYTLLAPSHGVRGHQGDLVIEDEVREQHDYRLQRAFTPTTTASRNPQRIKLSNAGDEDSVVLNDLRERRAEGAPFCYLEWSAEEHRDIDDREGWLEANPALGHGVLTMQALEDARRIQTPAGFETEHLCRWVVTMAPKLVDESRWAAGRSTLEVPKRPAMAISMDPSGTRASAAIAWQQTDGTIALRVIQDVTGEPVDVDKIGPDWNKQAIKLGVTEVGFDPWTDADLIRHFKTKHQVVGREYANASDTFRRSVDSGTLRWSEAEGVSEDLPWTARKPHESGAWMAVKAKEDRPITAVLAAIRAVWLASGPRSAAPRVM